MDSPQYNSVLENMDAIIKSLEATKTTGDLATQFQMNKWAGITANPTAKELVVYALVRIKESEAEFAILMEMMERITGLDQVVTKLRQTRKSVETKSQETCTSKTAVATTKTASATIQRAEGTIKTAEVSSTTAEVSSTTAEASSHTAEANSVSTRPFTPSDTEGKSLHQDTLQNKTRETEALVGPSLDHAVNDNTSEMVPPELTEYDTNNESGQTRSHDSHQDSVGVEHSDNLPVKTHEFSGPRLETFDHGYITASAATYDHEKSHEQSCSASSNLSLSTPEETASTCVAGTVLSTRTPAESPHTCMEAGGDRTIHYPTEESESSTEVHHQNVHHQSAPTLQEFERQHPNTNVHVDSDHDREDPTRRRTRDLSRERLNGIENINRLSEEVSSLCSRIADLESKKQTEGAEEGKKITLVSINCTNACACCNNSTMVLIGALILIFLFCYVFVYKYNKQR